MKRIYNILFTLCFLLSAPYYFMRMRRRGNWMDGFSQRFGRYNSKVKQAITNRRLLWIHAVSVGEVNICTNLIQALEYRRPNLKIVVSTTTTTGMAELNRKLPSHIQKIYYPIDRRNYVCRALATFHPEAVVLIEAEIWPNFLWRAHEMDIPAFLVNARISKRSLRGYKMLGGLFRDIFRNFTGISCQNEEDAQRLRDIGCEPEAIRVVGNLKYDAAQLQERRLVDVEALLKHLNVPTNSRLLVGGSTHAGEEGVLAEIYLRLRKRFPDLFLIVVPRHFERGKEAGRELSAHGIKFAYRSAITANARYKPGEIEALLVNTTGELKYFYNSASVIFIGKSLCAEGGQNPIEPALMGKTMVFGPNMQNFEAIAKAFVENNAAFQVKNATELESAFSRLLEDPKLAAEMGQRAMHVVRENAGGIERTIEMMLPYLE
jgi:3-deoxy-D-manno-octulosonic-acid transferase